MINKVKSTFLELFNNLEGVKFFFSPGRVNIIGEHIDYNGGYVMPCAISLGTYFAVRLNNLTKVRAYSLQFKEEGLYEFELEDDEKTHKWIDYIKGIIKIFNIKNGFDVVCSGTIPHSSGLSSSASFTTGLAFAVTTLLKKPVKNVELALKAKKVENEYMGVNCGIMDQFIVCNGIKNHALLLNCDTLQYEKIPMDLKEFSLVIINTNKNRKLVDSKYNERKKESEEILQILHEKGYLYNQLCEIKEEEFSSLLSLIEDEVLKKRFRHIVSENIRTLKAAEALKKGDIHLLGKYLIESHNSLKNDYEVSGVELDTIVESFLKQDGCIGSRMTGAGFGGCAIALVESTKVDKAKEQVSKDYIEKIGYAPSFYEVKISDCQIQL